MAPPVIPPPPDYKPAPAAAAIPPPPDAGQAPAPTTGLRDVIPDPLEVAGRALRVLRTPVKAAFDLAGKADVAAGIKTPAQAESRAGTYANIPIPMIVAALTGGASLPHQAAAQMATTQAMQEGGLEKKSPGQVIASGALPFVGEAGARLIRALGRTATRLVPDLFRRAQTGAQTELGRVQAGLAPPDATVLFKGARAAGADRIPASNLTRMLDDLDESIPADPVSPGLKAAREFMERARRITRSGEVSLGDLLRFRQDIGPMTRQAPQIQALYKATLGDLEAGSTAGTRLAVEALGAARQQHGAALFGDLVEKATDIRAVSGADVPALNVSKLAKLVQSNREDLTKFLGRRGMEQIEQFTVRYRSLPPTHAWTAANMGIAALAGGAGGIGLGPAGLSAAGLAEILKNMYAVGATPPATLAASRIVPLLAGGRASLGGVAEEAVKGKR